MDHREAADLAQTLRCHTGMWKGSASFRFAYQWKRNGITMAKQTSVSYRLHRGDTEKRISCVVTAANEYGSGRVSLRTRWRSRVGRADDPRPPGGP